MKRIKRALAGCLAVSMFFTGCSSLNGSMDIDPREVGTSVAAAADAETKEGETNGIRLNYSDTDKEKETPDYFAINLNKKFQELEGRAAFKTADSHPKTVTDLEIGGLRQDKTFVYAYTAEGDGQHVHCGAFYNYENGSFQVFHETFFTRDQVGEDEESLHIQVCTAADGTQGDIFLYDNGFGYLYDSAGTLKFCADIESFVREQYKNAYSLTVLEAMTDGKNRIYLELSIEKEEINIEPAEDADEMQKDEEDEEELNRQAEELENQIKDKVAHAILVYEFHEVSSYMSQEDLAFEKRKAEWKAMTEGVVLDSVPDAEADWAKAEEKYPRDWGGVTLTELQNSPVYLWKEGETFFFNLGSQVCTFLAFANTYTEFKELTANAVLPAVFSTFNNHYSRLYGKTGELEEYEEESISRTYTYKEQILHVETPEDGEGEPVVTVEEVEFQGTQTVTSKKKRRAPLVNAYTEMFWNLDESKAGTLGNSIGSDILCTSPNGDVYWIREGGTLESTGIGVGEDRRASAIHDGARIYYVSSESGRTIIISGGFTIVDHANLAGGFEPGDSEYDRQFADRNRNNSPGADVYQSGDYFTEENILPVSMNVDQELLNKLKEKDPDGGWTGTGGTWKGFLFTSRNHGLTYYEPSRESGIQLSNGSWYQSFRLGDTIVSVGFLSGDTSYDGTDKVHARVYEYKLDSLCKSMMEGALAQILEEEEKARQASIAAAGSTEETDETVKDPLEHWNEDFKEKHKSESETGESDGDSAPD